MKLTITTMSDLVFTLDVAQDMELENLKALCEFESGISAQQIVVMFEGKPLLDDKKDLKAYNIKDGDILLIQQLMVTDDNPQSRSSALPFDFSSIEIPSNSSSLPQSGLSNETDPNVIRDMLISNPEQIALLRINNPRLAEALETSAEEFSRVLREQQKARNDDERRRIRMLIADPFDSEAQRMIADEIQRQQIDSNMETAMEYHPESFGQVTMLYINCTVNGFPIQAFVDSGAQSTIMSKACAQRCNIMRLVDRRWSGIAKGVGTQRIMGRIHLVQIQIANIYLASSFTILEDQPMDMLLGLDMLKRHQCSIDLKRNVLTIGTSATETPFLNESELPEFAKHRAFNEDTEVMDHEDSQLAKAINNSLQESGSKSNSSSVSKSNSSSVAKSNSSSVASSSNTNRDFPERDIVELVNLGFKRQQVIEELKRFNGDKNQAMASLFAKSLSIPK